MELTKLMSCDAKIMPDESRRVLILNMPDMLSELLASVFRGGGLDIQVLNSIQESDMLPTLRRFQPNIVIAQASHAAALACVQPIKVYLLDPEALSTLCIKLQPICEDMGNVPLSQLVASVKAKNAH